MTTGEAANTAEPHLAEAGEQQTAVIRETVAMDALPDFYDRSFTAIGRVLEEQGVDPAAPAFGRYFTEPRETVELEVGFPVERAVRADGDVRPGILPGGRVARMVHHGGFNGLGTSWERLFTWVQEQGLTPGDGYWEVYVVEPTPDMDPDDLRVELDIPVTG